MQHKMVDVLVTTAGGIEEDFIKCMGHTYMGDFALKGEGSLACHISRGLPATQAWNPEPGNLNSEALCLSLY